MTKEDLIGCDIVAGVFYSDLYNENSFYVGILKDNQTYCENGGRISIIDYKIIGVFSKDTDMFLDFTSKLDNELGNRSDMTHQDIIDMFNTAYKNK